jgi:hypothetical protein
MCWKPCDQCTCVEIEATRMCSTCHTEIVGGLCNCYCPYCFHLLDECICNSGGYTGGGTSGGGSSGGGGSGGGGSGGGGSGGGNNSQSGNGLSYQLNPVKLTTSAASAVNTVKKGDPSSGAKTKKCNIGVKEMYKAFFGENTLPNYMDCMANQMVQSWGNNPQDWEPIDRNNYGTIQELLNEVQTYADEGYFVVAGWINSSGESGHVTVIVPRNGSEDMPYASKWHYYVPWNMDTGPGRRESKTPLSAGFGPDKKDSIVFYYRK